MTALAELPEQHKTAVGKILASIGHFIINIFHNAGDSFKELPPDQQEGAINGSQIAEIVKKGYASGENAVVDEVVKVTGLQKDVAEQAILFVAKESGINTTSVQDYLDHIADKVETGITDSKWNALWRDFGSFAATYLTQGKLDWVSLALGVLEYAFQTFVKGKI